MVKKIGLFVWNMFFYFSIITVLIWAFQFLLTYPGMGLFICPAMVVISVYAWLVIPLKPKEACFKFTRPLRYWLWIIMLPVILITVVAYSSLSDVLEEVRDIMDLNEFWRGSLPYGIGHLNYVTDCYRQSRNDLAERCLYMFKESSPVYTGQFLVTWVPAVLLTVHKMSFGREVSDYGNNVEEK